MVAQKTIRDEEQAFNDQIDAKYELADEIW